MNLTPNQKRALRRMWKHDMTFTEICEEMSFSESQLTAAADSLGLPERSDPDVYLPSPEQIRLECAAIRAAWTPAEREARRAAAWSARMENATEEHIHVRGSR